LQFPWNSIVFAFLKIFAVRGIEARALHMLGKCSTTLASPHRPRFCISFLRWGLAGPG
jgi:hypothetical protein